MRSEFGFTLAKALKFKSDLKKFTGDILTDFLAGPLTWPRSKDQRSEEERKTQQLDLCYIGRFVQFSREAGSR